MIGGVTRIGSGVLGVLGVLAAAACYEDTTALGTPGVLRAYAAERVQHCPVPFFSVLGEMVHVYEGADLVLREGGRVELTFYMRYEQGDDPINAQADTLRVAGTYRRDGFVLDFRFDEGYTRVVPMNAELVAGGRVVAAFPDGGNMEFVPAEQRPGGRAGECYP